MKTRIVVPWVHSARSNARRAFRNGTTRDFDKIDFINGRCPATLLSDLLTNGGFMKRRKIQRWNRCRDPSRIGISTCGFTSERRRLRSDQPKSR